MIKIIMSDMDGTLLDETGRLPVGFDYMMDQLRERGILFAPCSGRQYFSLLDSFEKYRDEFLFLAENGTMVMYRGQELFSSPMERSMAHQVLKAAEQQPAVYRIFCGKRDAYVLEAEYDAVIQAELDKYYTHSEVVEDFAQIADEPIKAAFFDPTGQAVRTIYPLLAPFRDRLQVVLSSDYWVDVMNADINKGVAVRQVQEYLHIKTEECAAFGDYMNDAEMLEAVGYSFAMENAHPDIKKIARFTTDSNADAGVLHGIQTMIDKGICG